MPEPAEWDILEEDAQDFEGGSAVPFISLTMDGKDGGARFNVTDEAREFLGTIESPMAVVSVVGMYRTGKSFLLNRILLDTKKGFPVGSSVNACTKGLWIWTRPIKARASDGTPVNLVVMDTEGLGSLDASTDHDCSIFALALLLSSSFIYNSVGTISETAIENLSLVVNLTKFIRVSTSKDGEEEDGKDFAQYFPKFLWVVRDFTLQLVDEHSRPVSARQYLESALQEVRGFSEKAQSKNRIRTMIRHFFPDRDCFPIVRPVEDEGMLQTLDVQPEHVFRSEFVTQMRALRSLVRSNAQPKTLEGGLVSGSMLCMLAESYVGAVNKGSVPCIKDTWTSVCEAEFQKKVVAVLSQYETAAKEVTKSFPITFEALHEWHAAQETAVLDEFASKTRTLQGQLGGSLERGIRSRLGERYKDLLSENERVCEAEGNKAVQKLYGEVDQKLLLNDYAEWSEYEVDRAAVKTLFFQQVPKSHSSKAVLHEFMEGAVASAAERMMNQRKLEHQREVADLNGDMRSEALAAQREKHALSMQVLEMQGKLQAVERERDAAVEESMDKGVESEEETAQLLKEQEAEFKSDKAAWDEERERLIADRDEAQNRLASLISSLGASLVSAEGSVWATHVSVSKALPSRAQEDDSSDLVSLRPQGLEAVLKAGGDGGVDAVRTLVGWIEGLCTEMSREAASIGASASLAGCQDRNSQGHSEAAAVDHSNSSNSFNSPEENDCDMSNNGNVWGEGHRSVRESWGGLSAIHNSPRGSVVAADSTLDASRIDTSIHALDEQRSRNAPSHASREPLPSLSISGMDRSNASAADADGDTSKRLLSRLERLEHSLLLSPRNQGKSKQASSSPTVNASVVDVRTESVAGSTFTLYTLLASTGDGEPVTICTRYKNLHKLHRTLSNMFPHLEQPIVASVLFKQVRASMWFNRFDPELIERRRVWIGEYVTFVMSTPQLAKSRPFLSFIGSGSLSSAPSTTAGSDYCASSLCSFQVRAPSEAGASIAGSASALPSHLRPVGEAVDGSPRFRVRDPSPRRVPSNPTPSEQDAENVDMNINGNGVSSGSQRPIFEGVASAKALPPRAMFNNKQGSSSSAFAAPPEKQNTPASAMHSMRPSSVSAASASTRASSSDSSEQAARRVGVIKGGALQISPLSYSPQQKLPLAPHAPMPTTTSS